MTTATHAIGAGPPQLSRGTQSGGNPLRKLLKALARVSGLYLERRRRYAAMRVLRQLDDRTLSDIGISRPSIPYAVNHGKENEKRKEYDVSRALMHQ